VGAESQAYRPRSRNPQAHRSHLASHLRRPHPWRVTQAYALQRFINACAGRGNLPIKFNGTLFTVDEVFDPDYRRWGGPYWLQNTRLPYWSMLASGDYDLMQPLF
jgi:alpha-L-fucosidase 2